MSASKRGPIAGFAPMKVGEIPKGHADTKAEILVGEQGVDHDHRVLVFGWGARVEINTGAGVFAQNFPEERLAGFAQTLALARVTNWPEP